MGENKHLKSDSIIESIMYRTCLSKEVCIELMYQKKKKKNLCINTQFVEYVKVHPHISSGASFARHSNQKLASKEVINVLSHARAHP